MDAKLELYPQAPEDPWDGAWTEPDEALMLDGSDSTPSASIEEYRYDVGDDGRWEDKDDDAKFSYTFEEPGEHTVLLWVKDSLGNTDETTRTVHVAENELPDPAFDHTPANPEPDQEVHLDPSPTTDDHEIVYYRWKIQDTSDPSDTHEYEQDADDDPPTYAFDEPGFYDVTLKAYDTHAHVASTTVTIQVGAGPTANLSASPADPAPGEEVTFDAGNSSAGDGDLTDAELDVDGDGETDYTYEKSPTVTHAYDQPGTYRANLTLVDEHGLTDSDQVEVTVAASSGDGGTSNGGNGGTRTNTNDGGGSSDGTYEDTGGTSTGGDGADGLASDTQGGGDTLLGEADGAAARAQVRLEVLPEAPTVGEEVTLHLRTDVDVDQTTWLVDGHTLEAESPVVYTFEENGTHEAKVLVETVDGTTLADRVEIPVDASDEASSSQESQAVPGPGAALAALALGGLACARRD